MEFSELQGLEAIGLKVRGPGRERVVSTLSFLNPQI